MSTTNNKTRIAKWAYILFGMVVLSVVLAFYFKNDHWVVFQVPTLSGKLVPPFSTSVWEMPLARLVALTFFSGVLFALTFFYFPFRIRRRLHDRKQDRNLKELEREVDRLRKDQPHGIREESVVVDNSMTEVVGEDMLSEIELPSTIDSIASGSTAVTNSSAKKS